MPLFEILGFSWERSAVHAGVSASVERVVFRYKQSLAQFVFDASALEGNPFTYPEVKTLMDGVTVGGHKISDQQQVLNLVAAAEALFRLVKADTFSLDKTTFDRLHGLVAREKALEWGHFRGEGEESSLTPSVALGEKGGYTPALTEPGGTNLQRIFSVGIDALNLAVTEPQERAMALFLFGALQQFYFDGNKRTARFMMNGILMSHGMDAISVPAVRDREFNEKMVRFYLTKDATEMMHFLIACQSKDTPKPESLSGLSP